MGRPRARTGAGLPDRGDAIAEDRDGAADEVVGARAGVGVTTGTELRHDPLVERLADGLARLPRRQLAALAAHLPVDEAVVGAGERGRDLADRAPDEATLATLEVRNLLRVMAGWRELEARSLPGPMVQATWRTTRQRLRQLRQERRLLGIAIPLRRELYYPAWQFAPDGAPLPGLPRLLAAAEEAGLDPVSLDALMTNPAAGDGEAPAERLRRGEEETVLALVRAALAHGA